MITSLLMYNVLVRKYYWLTDLGIDVSFYLIVLVKLMHLSNSLFWFLGRGKFFENCRVPSLDTLWVKNFDEIALSRTVKEIEAILCFAIFGKNPKIQNGRHFWGGEIFLRIAKSTFLTYPVGRKFQRNCSISHG